MMATSPAHSGPVRLDPPIPSVCPSRIANGSDVPVVVMQEEIEAASGTQRIVPAGTPKPVCHAGREKTALTPPPVFGQTTSSVAFQFESKVIVVPLSAVT